jgi:hypothetical protein
MAADAETLEQMREHLTAEENRAFSISNGPLVDQL